LTQSRCERSSAQGSNIVETTLFCKLKIII
jgi:hypothetical protein